MKRLRWLALVMVMSWCGWGQEPPPLRVAVVGLVHGHVAGFLGPALARKDIAIVGIAEPDEALWKKYAAQFKLDAKLYHRDLAEMLTAVRPQALLVYTDMKDHRAVVEAAAKEHVAVMMEKPLAVSVD